ncbi:hypothetical protein CWO84_10165 [Methylomonas sp. Kb3]|uniref:helix-turn-helix domain-containing protein n=1 Tax=Methylomonas sp. Kb3 TaxID=1611544 RepID=UPI000C3230B5|nr:helix-turn-helix transcriptional regulator [Methylomonas sp. Kb3]PKD40492.1 hypothetical protein CWO84_10165 [Methylomonas sp. Kb3]
MSPFSDFLRSFRLSNEIPQAELADLMGCNQTFISALENGVRSRPSKDFVDKFVSVFDLTEAETLHLYEVYEASNNTIMLDPALSQDAFRMFHELREKMADLAPIQVKLMRDIVTMKDHINEPQTKARIIRRRNVSG